MSTPAKNGEHVDRSPLPVSNPRRRNRSRDIGSKSDGGQGIVKVHARRSPTKGATTPVKNAGKGANHKPGHKSVRLWPRASNESSSTQFLRSTKGRGLAGRTAHNQLHAAKTNTQPPSTRRGLRKRESLIFTVLHMCRGMRVKRFWTGAEGTTLHQLVHLEYRPELGGGSGSLCWAPVEGDQGSVSVFSLASMKELLIGKLTESLKGCREREDCCFSVRGADQLVCLAAPSRRARAAWLEGINLVVTTAGGKRRRTLQGSAKVQEDIRQSQHWANCSLMQTIRMLSLGGVFFCFRGLDQDSSHHDSPPTGFIFVFFRAAGVSVEQRKLTTEPALWWFPCDEHGEPLHNTVTSHGMASRREKQRMASGATTHRVELHTLNLVHAGKPASSLQPGQEADRHRCLTLMYGSNQILNLQAPSKGKCAVWIHGIRALASACKGAPANADPASPTISAPARQSDPASSALPLASEGGLKVPSVPISPRARKARSLRERIHVLSAGAVFTVAQSFVAETRQNRGDAAKRTGRTSSFGSAKSRWTRLRQIFWGRNNKSDTRPDLSNQQTEPPDADAKPPTPLQFTRCRLFFSVGARVGVGPEKTGVLYLCEPSQRAESAEACLPVSKLLCVESGKCTAELQSLSAPDELCFALRSGRRVFSLVAGTREERDTWVRDISFVIQCAANQAPLSPRLLPAPLHDPTYDASMLQYYHELSRSHHLRWYHSADGEEEGNVWKCTDVLVYLDAGASQDGMLVAKVADGGAAPPWSLHIDTIQEVWMGKQTAALQSHVAVDSSERACFSLITKRRSISLEAKSQLILLAWLKGLHRIITTSGGKALSHDVGLADPNQSNHADASSPALSPIHTPQPRRLPAGDKESIPAEAVVAATADRNDENAGLPDSLQAWTANMSDHGPLHQRFRFRTGVDLEAAGLRERLPGVQQSSPYDVFSGLQRIGKGSFGTVCKIIDNRDGRPAAVKILRFDGTNMDRLLHEIEMLRTCESPFIVSYRETYVHHDCLWLVMEWCGAGSLLDLMTVCQRTLTEPQIACVLAMTLQGLKYLHNRGVIHRDIKAANILLTHQGEAKLADFGVSAMLSETLHKQTSVGTPHWMAPEVIMSGVAYDARADVWSLGITALELAQGAPPHASDNPMRAAYRIAKGPAPALTGPPSDGADDQNSAAAQIEWSEKFQDFLRHCLSKDPAKRATAEALLAHAFVAPHAADKEPVLDMLDSLHLEMETYRAEQQSMTTNTPATSQQQQQQQQPQGTSADGPTIQQQPHDIAVETDDEVRPLLDLVCSYDDWLALDMLEGDVLGGVFGSGEQLVLFNEPLVLGSGGGAEGDDAQNNEEQSTSSFDGTHRRPKHDQAAPLPAYFKTQVPDMESSSLEELSAFRDSLEACRRAEAAACCAYYQMLRTQLREQAATALTKYERVKERVRRAHLQQRGEHHR